MMFEPRINGGSALCPLRRRRDERKQVPARTEARIIARLLMRIHM